MGSTIAATHLGCLPFGACVASKSNGSGSWVLDSRGSSSALAFGSSVHYSPTFFRIRAVHGETVRRPLAPFCRSCQAGLGERENLGGRALGMKESQGRMVMFTALNFLGKCSIANGRATNRRLVGMMGAAASATNTTAGPHGDGAPVPKPADVGEPLTQLPMQQIALLAKWKPPRYMWRSVACIILAGQVCMFCLS